MTLLLLHILIALSSVAFTTYVFIAPTKRRINISYGLVGLTLASGTVLILSSPAHMLQACVSGLVYVSIISVAILAARHKLARVSA